ATISQFSVEGDDKVLLSGSISTFEAPKDLLLDVSGVETLTVRLLDRACLLRPVLTKFGVRQEQHIRSISPKSDSTIREDSANFQWSPDAENSLSFVLITAVHVAEGEATRRAWAYPVEGAVSTVVDVKGLPDGNYVWQVLSVDKSGQTRGYGPTDTFVLSRHNRPDDSRPSSLAQSYSPVPIGEGFVYPDSPVAGTVWPNQFTDHQSFIDRGPLLVTSYICVEVPREADRLVVTAQRPYSGEEEWDLAI